MILCERCGTKIRKGTKFCSNCGAMFCRNCGRQRGDDASSCPHCNWGVDDDFSSVQKYFELFGLSSDASITEVKKAFRTLMKDFHPDSNQNKGAEFQKFINEKSKEYIDAYEKIMEYIEKTDRQKKRYRGKHPKKEQEDMYQEEKKQEHKKQEDERKATDDLCVRERHGFTTFILFGGVIAYPVIGIIYFIISANIGNILYIGMIVSGVYMFSQAICCFLLLKWRKAGYWLLIAFSIIFPFVLLIIPGNFNYLSTMIGSVIGIGFTFLILKIRKHGKSTWEQLK